MIPSFCAASTRPCPAMMPPSSSIRTGVVQPHSLMLPAIWDTWVSECVLAFRAYGIKLSTDRRSTLSAGHCGGFAFVLVNDHAPVIAIKKMVKAASTIRIQPPMKLIVTPLERF